MAVLLALASAVGYGVSDFVAGLLSRRQSFLQVALLTQGVLLLAVAASLPWTAAVSPSPAGLGWGALAGLGGALGTLALYRGLGRGQMSVVGPLSAATAAVVPVLVGVLTGERPSALALTGVAVALPAVALVASAPADATSGGLAAGVPDGLLAGAGFGLIFVGLDRAGGDTGLWPVLASAVASFAVVAAIWGVRRPAVVREGIMLGVLAGLLAAAAVVLYFEASHGALLAVVAVVASLYPAFTVLLARLVLKERLTGRQQLGLVLAGVALVTITAG